MTKNTLEHSPALPHIYSFLDEQSKRVVSRLTKKVYGLFQSKNLSQIFSNKLVQFKENYEQLGNVPNNALLSKAIFSEKDTRIKYSLTAYQYALVTKSELLVQFIENRASNVGNVQAEPLNKKLLEQREELDRKGMTYEVKERSICGSLGFTLDSLMRAYQYASDNLLNWIETDDVFNYHLGLTSLKKNIEAAPSELKNKLSFLKQDLYDENQKVFACIEQDLGYLQTISSQPPSIGLF